MSFEKDISSHLLFLFACLYFSTRLILWVRKCEYVVLESHESKTSDLTRLLYHAWFPKLHTHIYYSQYFHSVGGYPNPKGKATIFPNYVTWLRLNHHVILFNLFMLTMEFNLDIQYFKQMNLNMITYPKPCKNFFWALFTLGFNGPLQQFLAINNMIKGDKIYKVKFLGSQHYILKIITYWLCWLFKLYSLQFYLGASNLRQISLKEIAE